MANKIYLIRHGETDWNRERRWQGHADVPLNDKGRWQAALLASHLQRLGITFDAIYSSDLARAYQTAWEVGAAVKVAVQLLPSLREIDIGVWAGLTITDIKERYPVEYELMSKNQDIPRGGAETLAALKKRMSEAVATLVYQRPAQSIALVTHGGPIRMFLSYLAEKTGTEEPRLSAQHIGNTSMTIIRHEKPNNWETITVNDMQHLMHLDNVLEMISMPPDETEFPQGWEP